MMYVLGFAFDYECPDLSVLLIRKAKPAWQKGKLNGVGGKIEPGEKPLVAMVREFFEETTILTEEKDWIARGLMEGVATGPDHWSIYVYAARLDGKLKPGMHSPTEEKLVVKKVSELWQCKDLIFNLHWIIPYCMDGNMKPFSVVDAS